MPEKRLSDKNKNGLKEMYERREQFFREHPDFRKQAISDAKLYMREYKIRREIISAQDEGREPDLTEELNKAHYDGETSIVVPQDETVIKTGRFRQCWGLQSVTLPQTVVYFAKGEVELGDNVFGGTTRLMWGKNRITGPGKIGCS